MFGMVVGQHMINPSSIINEDLAEARSTGSNNGDLIGMESLFVDESGMPSIWPSQRPPSVHDSSPSAAHSDLPSISLSKANVSSLSPTPAKMIPAPTTLQFQLFLWRTWNQMLQAST